MHRDLLIACLPYLAAIAVLVAALRWLVHACGARLHLPHLRRLHRDQLGGVQSLSFVLTLPVFIMVLMFIVQLSQITMARIVVEYAAFAAARSAMVWIPANTGDGYERENEISVRSFVDQQGLWSIYEVEEGSPKYQRIQYAAAMALLPVCPSRDLPMQSSHPGMQGLPSLLNAYQSMDPASASNPRMQQRLQNKLAYALENTDLYLELRHRVKDPPYAGDPPLLHYDIGAYYDEFSPNEFGWQDQILVTLTHRYALLPGPGRLLARRADARPGTSPQDAPGTDRIAQNVDFNQQNGIYSYELTTTVRVSNEGEKPVVPYVQGNTGGLPPMFPPVDDDFDDDLPSDPDSGNSPYFPDGDPGNNPTAIQCCPPLNSSRK